MPSPQFTLKSETFQVGKLKIRQLQPRLPSSKWLSTIYHLPGLIYVPLQIVFDAFTCRLVHRGPASLTRPTAASRPAHRSNTWNVTSFPARNSTLPRSTEHTMSRRWTLQSSDSRPPCPPFVSLPLPLPSWCADAALHRSEGRVMQS